MSVFGKNGVRCDWCGKISNHPRGEYVRPNPYGFQLAGYIHQANYEKDDGKDICEECAAGRCPHCSSDQIVWVTPMKPGPDGWGWRCKSCGNRWELPMPTKEMPEPYDYCDDDNGDIHNDRTGFDGK